MAYLTLSDIKKHLNIDAAFTDDDNYLMSLDEVVEAIIAKHIEVPLADIAVEGVLPPPLRHAALLLIGNYYMNRESVSVANMTEIPLSYEYLIGFYKNYVNYQG